MSDMNARDVATMRSRGLNENGGPMDFREPRCTDGAPETHCSLCCEPLSEPDGQCADPGCAS